MNNEISIWPAVVADIKIIRQLAEKIWPDTYKDILSQGQIDYMMELFYSADALKEQLKKHHFIIAFFGEEPVGFASYSSSSVEYIYKLHKLYVDSAMQGRGIGRALINYVVKASGALAIELNVNRNNKAKMFYERLGFEVVREEDIDIGGNYWMNDFVMRWIVGITTG